jgi:hypothetical protein
VCVRRQVAKYRELCPPGTADSQIQKLIGQCKGDAQRMENAISELWEDSRGNAQDDDWAVVSKKSSKKKHVRPSLVLWSIWGEMDPDHVHIFLCVSCRTTRTRRSAPSRHRRHSTSRKATRTRRRTATRSLPGPRNGSPPREAALACGVEAWFLRGEVEVVAVVAVVEDLLLLPTARAETVTVKTTRRRRKTTATRLKAPARPTKHACSSLRR